MKENIRTSRRVKKISPEYLHNAGLYYLQRFAASRAHFRAVMTRKIRKSCAGHPDQDMAVCLAWLESVIEKFVELGLLDDDTYTRASITRLRRQGLSKRAIFAKLTPKGLPAENLERALAQHDGQTPDGDADWQAALRYCQRKKLGPYAPDQMRKNGPEEEQRLLARLGRAGFSYETARRVLNFKIE